MSTQATVLIDSTATVTLSTTAVIPVLNGAVTGTGSAIAAQVTLADLFASTVLNIPAGNVLSGTFGANKTGGADTGTYVFPGAVTFAGLLSSATALATPSALAATALNTFASTVSGATLMGFGTTHDVALKNRAGTTAFGVKANTLDLGVAGQIQDAAANRYIDMVTGTGLRLANGNGAATIDIRSDMILLTGGSVAATAVTVDGSLKSTKPTGGLGYATGAGGTVTQGSGSGKATAFTLSTITGQITTDNAILNAGTIVSATWTNTAIAATDTVIINHVSGGTVGAYTFNVQCGAGTATLNIRNATAGNLTEALVLQFNVIKGVNA